MRYLSRTGAASLAFVVLSLLPAGPAAGQTMQRIIPFPEWASSYEEDEEVPLELIEIKVAGTPVVLGQPFMADHGWLKDMTMSVKNISDKPIVAFHVGGGLLGEVDEELPMHASYQYGVGWGWGKGFYANKELPSTTVVKPGEVVELNYENVGALTRKVLAKKGEGAFCKLKFMAPAVQYADGAVASMPKMRFYGEGKPKKSR